MKKSWKTRLFALVLCLTLLASCLPMTAFADSAETVVEMTAGDMLTGFAPAGTDCDSSDPSVAWVDSQGDLRALKAGTATVSVPGDEGQTDHTVIVSLEPDANSQAFGRFFFCHFFLSPL